MKQLTLIGGPCDGRTIQVNDATASCTWLDVAHAFPMRPNDHPLTPPVFYRHRYNMQTGIYHSGKMPSDPPATPWSFTLFGPRVERWLARIDARRH